ncbi:MAG TPA: FAD-dependent oxidoreductase, partial [Solirubrobacteraceae bacterium]|nr:FAD-dependent oxidoreductase [Solirubrobacteraceae bacterium]
MIARSQAIAALAGEEFDVVVVGGGITGAGVALDAATRGYSVALLEKADYASGTSSRSSKLVHGGLRYLQNFDLGLVREALLERQLLVRLAPHLVRPLPLVVPAFEGARPDRLVGVGLNLYDVMAVDRLRGRRRETEDWSPDRHRVISGEEVVELLPALAPREPTSGYLFYDCQTDDARLVLTVLGEAERFGAVCANRLEVLELLAQDGRAVGVRARDAESGEAIEVRGANIVNATGVWADRLRPEELHDEAEVPRIRPSRGTHITLSSEHIPMKGT